MHPKKSWGEGAVTGRVVALSLVLLVLCAPAAFYGELLYGATYTFASGVPGTAPLVILFALTAVNPLIGRLRLRAFSRQELLALYGIIVVGAPLVTHGILGWMLPTVVTWHYVARAIPEWGTTFLPHVPTWFSPSDPAAVEGYFQGGMAVPWSLWLTPLIAWSSFMIALFLSTLFLMVLLRRQWITNERLSFPLAQVPLEVVREGRGHGARLPLTALFWLGFALSFGLTSLSRLALIFPAIPDLPQAGSTIIQWQPVGPLAGLGALELWLVPWMIAVAYLVPKELSFSCWFFWFVRVGLTVAAIAAGATPQRPEEWWGSTFPAPTHQGGGAVLAILGWTLWIGRRHLGRALRLALSGQSNPNDPDEPITYRWAVLGFLASFGFLLYFCWLAGTRPVVGAVIVGLIVANYVVWARLRAETGLGFIPFPLIVDSMIVVPFGSAVLRPRELVTLYATRWSYFPGFGESFEVCTGNSLEAFKVADSARVPARPLFLALVAGFLVALVAGIYVVMRGMYHFGFFNTRISSWGWLSGQLRANGAMIFTHLASPSSFDLSGTIAMGAGAAVTVVLGLLRLRFWWWPLHPIGYLAANCWGMHWFFQPFLIGWALKVLAIRYGGLRLFRRTTPLAIGLIIGDFGSEGLWVGIITVARAAGLSI